MEIQSSIYVSNFNEDHISMNQLNELVQIEKKSFFNRENLKGGELIIIIIQLKKSVSLFRWGHCMGRARLTD